MDGKRVTRSVVIYPFTVGTSLNKDILNDILDPFRAKGLPVLVDADSVFSKLHIASALMHAARSIHYGEARAREPSIEVLRWISGSHQVSRGIVSAGPGTRTERVLLLLLPHEWPLKCDTEGLPEISEMEWAGDPVHTMNPCNVPIEYGQGRALERLGLDQVAFSNIDDMEKAVLEMVCYPDLR